ncbi:MAG: hypothetical protein U1E14_04475 [Geminicoccaceae bacterium]
MTQPDDALLMAYADGEVTPEQAAEVEAMLARDPEARALVASFRDSASMVRAAFQSALDEPVPPALLAAARGQGQPAAAAANANVVAFKPRTRRPAWIRGALPLAASVAVAVVAGGWWLETGSGTADPLSVALSSTPASQPVTVAANASVVPVSTFKIADGRWCREFERTAGADRAAGVACRGDDGAWQVEILLPAEPAEAAAQEGYALAGAEDSPVDAWLDQAGAAAAVPPADEAALIAGWR